MATVLGHCWGRFEISLVCLSLMAVPTFSGSSYALEFLWVRLWVTVCSPHGFKYCLYPADSPDVYLQQYDLGHAASASSRAIIPLTCGGAQATWLLNSCTRLSCLGIHMHPSIV